MATQMTQQEEKAGYMTPTGQLLRYFDDDTALPDRLREVNRPLQALAHELVSNLSVGPELTTGIRKLLEARDCFLRAALD